MSAAHGRLRALAFGLLTGFALAELGARATVRFELLGSGHAFTRFMRDQHVPPGLGTQLFERVADPMLRWVPIPGARSGHIRINSGGFRGPDTPLVASPDTLRVAVLGDSETFCEGLPEERSFTGALERHLSHLGRVEVLNFGVPGYDTAQELRLLERKVSAYEPSVLVLNYTFNDPAIGVPTLLLGSRWSAWSTFLSWGRFALRPVSGTERMWQERKDLPSFYLALHEQNWDRVASMIHDMEFWASSHQAAFYVLVQPEMTVRDLTANYPYAAIHEDLAALASPTVRVVDALEVLRLRSNDTRDHWRTSNDPHKDALANDLMARLVAGAIEADGAIRR